MKIFLTGATGFVGSHVLNAAHAAGHEVVALRRQGSVSRVQPEREPVWVEGSLAGDYKSQLKGCDAFVHLASHTPNPPYADLRTCLLHNVIDSVALAEQARLAGVQKFLIAGSCFEYGKSAERFENIPVTAPLEPTLSYPTSKAAASVAFMGFAAEHAVQLQILRIFQVYGEGELESRLWPSIKAAAEAGKDLKMTAGEQVRDFIHVSDVARTFIENLGFVGIFPGAPVIKHVGSGKPMTILQFTQYWWNLFGATGTLQVGAIPYRQNEMMRYVPII